jgi:hypothetical protein
MVVTNIKCSYSCCCVCLQSYANGARKTCQFYVLITKNTMPGSVIDLTGDSPPAPVVPSHILRRSRHNWSHHNRLRNSSRSRRLARAMDRARESDRRDREPGNYRRNHHRPRPRRIPPRNPTNGQWVRAANAVRQMR